MISDEDIHAALDYLRDSSKDAAIARSQAKTLDKYVGIVEAERKALHKDKSNSVAQDLARASPEYRQAIDAWQEAVKRDAQFQMLREAALSRINAWQTWSANNRHEIR